MSLDRVRHWIFDLDGTLTVAVHDFDAIREELGIPSGTPILEHLETLQSEEARPLRDHLDDIEKRLARRARRSPGARELLETLASRGARVGILTRNSHENAMITLRACGLAAYFDDDALVARDHAPPKPDPAGIIRLLEHWGADPVAAVLVGDFLFDLQAGRAAGVRAVYYDPDATGRWSEHADVTVRSLFELVPGAAD
jgi:HAD superfamily hydrolase (TIGR01509 family)